MAGRLAARMTIVEVRDERTYYQLTAQLRDGELVLAGSAERVDRSGDGGLARIRELLAPHGISASIAWKSWLEANRIPYDFSVWR